MGKTKKDIILVLACAPLIVLGAVEGWHLAKTAAGSFAADEPGRLPAAQKVAQEARAAGRAFEEDQIRPEVLAAGLLGVAALPKAEGRPAEDELIAALSGHARDVDDVRRLVRTLTADGAPAPNPPPVHPRLKALAAERSGLADLEAKLRELVAKGLEAKEDLRALAGPYGTYRASPVADTALVQAADAILNKKDFNEESIRTNDTLILVLKTEGLSEDDRLRRTLAQIQQQLGPRLMGDSLMLVEANKPAPTPWNAARTPAVDPGTFRRLSDGAEDWPRTFEAAFAAIAHFQGTRGDKPFRTILIWRSNYNPDERRDLMLPRGRQVEGEVDLKWVKDIGEDEQCIELERVFKQRVRQHAAVDASMRELVNEIAFVMSTAP